MIAMFVFVIHLVHIFLFCIVLCVSHCTLRFILTSQHNRGDSKCIPMPSTILPVCSVIRDRESEQK